MKNTYKLTTIDTPGVTVKGKQYTCMTYPMSFNEFLEKNEGMDIYLFEATDKQVRAVVKDADEIWVVEARNNNFQNEHLYVVGVYEDYDTAKKAASIEEQNRGGKYTCSALKYPLNKLPETL